MTLFAARHKETGELLKTKRVKFPYYTSLSLCRSVTKKVIKYMNQKRDKPDRHHFEDYEIVEFVLHENRIMQI